MSRRRALAVLLATLVSVTVLGIIGLGVEDDLQPTSLVIPGTSSAGGEALARSYFGESVPFVVVLRGPRAAIDRQGPRLVAGLRRDRAETALSPWERAAPPPGACPARTRALVLVSFHRPLAEAIRDTVPELERTLATHVHRPVPSRLSPDSRPSPGALQRESLTASERAELLAAPLLIIVLLLVFRSLVAAAIPLAFGAMTVFAGRGVLVFVSSFMRIDALSLVVCTMMGLALGVDYSLFIVSRFREELAAGHDPPTAAFRSRRTAGRTAAFAGSTLFISIFVSAFLQPGTLLVSLATALAVVTAISVAVAWGSLPALLALLGSAYRRRPDRPSVGRGPWLDVVADRRRGQRRAPRRPAIAAAAIAIRLPLPPPRPSRSTPARPGSTSSPPRARLASTPKRSTAPSARAGEAPFCPHRRRPPQGPITTPRRLSLLSRWQRHIASKPGVKTVIGLGRLGGTAELYRALVVSSLSVKTSRPRRSLPLACARRRRGRATAGGLSRPPPAPAC